MASRTEQALDAFAAALDATGDLPTCERDRTLPGEFTADDSGVGRWLCLRWGDAENIEQMLGTGDGPGEAEYEIDHVAELEWMCQHDERATRMAAWDAGLEAIAGAIEADRSLGDVVGHSEISGMQFANLATDGMPEIQAVNILVRLTFTSNRPF